MKPITSVLRGGKREKNAQKGRLAWVSRLPPKGINHGGRWDGDLEPVQGSHKCTSQCFDVAR